MQTITIKHADDTTSSGVVTPVVQVAFERHFKTGITVMADAATMRMEHIYWLAWQATTAGRQNRPGFDEWLETVVEIEQAEVEDADPLVPTPPPGTSLPSPSNPD